jgi:acylphosphatase
VPEQQCERCEVIFRGTVQGVGFRFTTRRIAVQLPVTGFVENLPDGGVRLVVEGTAPQIEELLAAIREAFGDYIQRMEPSIRPAPREFSDFSIRY